MLSSSASALTITLDAVPTGESHYVTSWNCMYEYSGSWVTNQSICSVANLENERHTSVYAIQGQQYFEFKQGYYYEFFIGIQSPDAIINEGIMWFPAVNSDWTLVDFEQVSDDSGLEVNQNGVYNGYPYVGGTLSTFSKLYRVVLYSNVTSNRHFEFGTRINTFVYMNESITRTGKTNISVGQIREYKPSDIVEAINENTESVDNPEYIQQEKEDLENQKQESEDTAEDSSSAAQDTATSLLNVIVQTIGVFSSASPTSCSINGDLIPHLPLGNLNLCQHSPPPAITALGSILLLGFVVPLAYHLVKRMLALIGSFQT